MIGKINKVPLRDIWRGEASDFTTWLFDNIDTLNDQLGLNLTVTDREKGVGSFSADIVAEDESGTIVVIENQLEKTDHDHLGKMVTYLSNIENAKKAIWITGNPREEHKNAIQWLNEFTPDDVCFFLVKLEAIRIENSDAAALFTVVAEPTEFVKEIGKEKKEYAERHILRKSFWMGLLEIAKRKTRLYDNVSASVYTWIGTGAGKAGMSYNFVVTNNYVSVELYLDRGKEYPELNKQRFDELIKHKEKIEESFGGSLTWERLNKKRASRIVKKFEGSLRDKENWPAIQERLVDGMINLESSLRPFVRSLSK